MKDETVKTLAIIALICSAVALWKSGFFNSASDDNN